MLAKIDPRNESNTGRNTRGGHSQSSWSRITLFVSMLFTQSPVFFPLKHKKKEFALTVALYLRKYHNKIASYSLRQRI